MQVILSEVGGVVQGEGLKETATTPLMTQADGIFRLEST